mmetsp:Transcript_51791/g.105408  ORF Transcript_51791/g.105408 Transcript_51791/m.105408 type:complete len:518 (+) Transcript_51791:192-1745(+)
MRDRPGGDPEWFVEGRKNVIPVRKGRANTARSMMAMSASIVFSVCSAMRPLPDSVQMTPQKLHSSLGLRSEENRWIGTIEREKVIPSSTNLRLRGGGVGGGLVASAVQWSEDFKGRFQSEISERFSELQTGLKQKRLELCPWEEFAIECEEAFTYHQLWINPCQGWNRMQRVVDSAAKRSQGSAFVPSRFWPATVFLMAQNQISEFGSKHTTSPPFGSNRVSSWFSQPVDGERLPVEDVTWVNDKLVQTAMQMREDSSWESVSDEGGLTVWRKYFSKDTAFAGKNIGSAAKFACVKARSVIDAPLETVYELFLDNTRVQEYNEYCKDVVDLEWLDQSTKVTHSFTGRPWSRDFVTRVHYRSLGEDARIVVSRAEDHPLAQEMGGYTRMEMALGANIMQRCPDDPSKTEFTLITHVNPGGFASTQFGAAVTNRLSTESPRVFLTKLARAANSGRDTSKHEEKNGLGSQLRKHARGGIGVAALGAMTLLRRKGGGGHPGEDGAQMFAPELTASFAGASG